jgi:hypothetical protein
MWTTRVGRRSNLRFPVTKSKAPRYRFENYLQVPANLRQLILDKNLSQAEILTFLLACEETVGKGRRAVHLSHTDIAAKNNITVRTAIRARASLKEHGMLAVDVSENCWKTHESALVSPNFSMIQAGSEVRKEGDPVRGATDTADSRGTDMDVSRATDTGDREIHLDQNQEKDQKIGRQADSPAAPRKTREANPVSQSMSALNTRIETAKADSPAKTAGEENPFSVEEEKTKADQSPQAAALIPISRSWTAFDVNEIQKRLAAFMEGEEPPAKLMDWICSAFEGVCSARDVCAALDAAWNRSAAPGTRNAPRTWNWFYPTLRNALIAGEVARLPERPAVPHPEHRAAPAAIARGVEAIELPSAPRSIVEAVLCSQCGGCALVTYTDGSVEGCLCRQERSNGFSRISASNMTAILDSVRIQRNARA